MIKERILQKFGLYGIFPWYTIMLIISIFPFVFIDCNFIIKVIFIGIQLFIPYTAIIFWIWGFIGAILGKQDIYAIIYYILFAGLMLPTIIPMFFSLFKKKN